MTNMKKWIYPLAFFLLLTGLAVSPCLAQDAPPIVVGRILEIEGDLFSYVPEDEDWVPVVADAPVGAGDSFFSGNEGLAEMTAPNGVRVRLGNGTQVQFITLDPDLTEVDVASGQARFYNQSAEALVKATSSFGDVLAGPGAVFDFYVGENSVEVVAVKGSVSFVHAATQVRYAVTAGAGSIRADARQVSPGEGDVNPEWDKWNQTQDGFWAAKAREGGRSVQYLPPSLQNEAYALEENGTWEQVPYEGRPCWFWRPTAVAVGWSPFTVGRWTDWHGDETWIPAEPFGYVTHHYGNWIFVRNAWFWAPPVVRVRVGLPLLNVGFFWWPGRVFWIHSGINVGWVPLAPRETYYCRRPWGGRQTVVVTNISIARIRINIQEHAYVSHAVVVPRDRFFGVRDYRSVRLTRFNRAAIVNDYRAAPIVNNSVIDRWTTLKQRYDFTDRQVAEKPHRAAMDRVRRGPDIGRAGGRERASTIQERLRSMPEGRIEGRARVEAPQVKNYIVPLEQSGRPSSEIQFQQKEIKTFKRPAPQAQPGRAAEPERVRPARPAPQEQPARPAPPARFGKPEVVTPTRPAPQEQPGRAAEPERVRPARPAPQEQPAKSAPPARFGKPEVVTPTRPAPPEQPGRAAEPERLRPTRPAPQEQPARPAPPARFGKPEVVTPARPAPQEQPGRVAEPERVRPTRPTLQEQPAQVGRPEVGRPARPTQPAPPAQVERPERVRPAKPGQPEPAAVEKEKKQEETEADQQKKKKE